MSLGREFSLRLRFNKFYELIDYWTAWIWRNWAKRFFKDLLQNSVKIEKSIEKINKLSSGNDDQILTNQSRMYYWKLTGTSVTVTVENRLKFLHN